mmetsp:Transcript_9760/g.44472  ORF Transcript_9760/g.44472 Transcript_9760/m.44472 type:complete len:368 (-) Transcript_9760:112-1215(-)
MSNSSETQLKPETEIKRRQESSFLEALVPIPDFFFNIKAEIERIGGSAWVIRMLAYFLCFLTLCVMFGLFTYYLLPARRLSLESLVTSEWQNPSRQTKSSTCEGKKKFILIGDSTMARARDALKSIAFQNCSLTSSAGRCDFPKLYGLPYNQTALEVPVPPHVGPAVNGLKNRGCWDCSGCESNVIECVDGDIEYHGIEFAADVEYPTNGYSLTQESIIAGYMSKRANPNCDYVVFKFGLHDTATTGDAPEIFGEQLDYVCELLLRVYSPDNLLYVTSTYPKGTLQPAEWRNITSPSAIFGLNQESRRVMQKRNINVLDVATMSTFPVFQALYTDAVHIGSSDQAWYRSVAFSIFERSLHWWSQSPE